MADIKLEAVEFYYSYTPGNKPQLENLSRGEIAFNIADRKMFMRVGSNATPDSDTLGEFQLTPYAVGQLSDALIQSVADNQVLAYSADDSKWHNVSLTTAHISDFTTEVTNAITESLGDSVQAHSDQLDKLSALADAGFIYRSAAGDILGLTMSAADSSVTVSIDEGGKTAKVSLPVSGVTAGAYTKVTVNDRGVVTQGENPNTLAGYGITDAMPLAGGTATGVIKYAAGVTEAAYDDQTLVTKKYADSVALGYTFHTSCATGTNENLEGSYQGGSGTYPGVGATFTLTADTGNTTQIGGLVLRKDMRVMLLNQTDKTQNGCYVVTTFPEEATGQVVLTRADDFDGEPTINYQGATFLITHGNLRGTSWRLMNKGTVTFGTTEIEFVQISAPNEYTAGAGISIDANAISVKQGSTVAVIGGNLEVTSGTGNQGKVLVANGDGTAATWQAFSLDSGIEGTLSVSKGGTGATTLPAGQLVVGNGTEPVGAVANAEGVLIGTASAAPTFGQVDLTKHVTGVLPVANGGTGASTTEGAFAAIAPAGANKGDIMYYDGAKWVALAKGANNSILGVDESGNLGFVTKITAGTF